MNTMLQQEPDDRRKYVRFTLKAYGLNHRCYVGEEHERQSVQLIDITPAGARLRQTDTQTGKTLPKQGQIVPIELLLPPFAPKGRQIPGEIRWSEGQECGIMFTRELECSVGELQRALDTPPVSGH